MPTLAHHAATAFFGDDIVVIEGTLRGARIINPHSYFRVTTDDGTDWVFESQQSGTLLREMGFTPAMFASGMRVVMTGDANRDGRSIARWRTVTFPGATPDDDVEVYLVGRMQPEPWQEAIRDAGDPCRSGLDACFRLDAADRDEFERRFGGSLGLW